MSDEDFRRLRILPFNRAAGPYQLALTEAVIDAVGNGDAPATLRMYSWSHDSIIVGVGQSTSQLDIEACRSMGCDILRRISGGTAVFHDEHTVSFQLALPSGHPFLSDDIHVNYRRIADIIVSTLATIGVQARWATLDEARGDLAPNGLDAICFSSLAPFEVLAGTKKLVGLAQVRRQTVSALQGMLYLRSDPSKSVRLVSSDAEERHRLSTVLSGRTTDLVTATGREIEGHEVAAELSRAVIDALNAEPIYVPLTELEVRRAHELVRMRYGNPEWTFRR